MRGGGGSSLRGCLAVARGCHGSRLCKPCLILLTRLRLPSSELGSATELRKLWNGPIEAASRWSYPSSHLLVSFPSSALIPENWTAGSKFPPHCSDLSCVFRSVEMKEKRQGEEARLDHGDALTHWHWWSQSNGGMDPVSTTTELQLAKNDPIGSCQSVAGMSLPQGWMLDFKK